MSLKLGEFFFDLVVDAGKGELTVGQMATKITELQVATIGEIAVLSEFITQLARLTEQSIGASEHLTGLKEATGANMETWQKFSGMGHVLGMAGDSMSSAMKRVSDELENARSKGESALLPLANFAHLDLFNFDPKKPEAFIEALRKSREFASMPYSKQSMLIREAFGGEDLMRYLHASDKAVKEAMGHAAVLPEDDVTRFNAIGHQFKAMSEDVKQIGQDISAWFSPALMESLEVLKTTLHAMRKLFDMPSMRKATVSEASKADLNTVLKEIFKFGAGRAGLNVENMRRWSENPTVPEYLKRPEPIPTAPQSTPVTNVNVKIGARELDADIHRVTDWKHNSEFNALNANLNQSPA